MDSDISLIIALQIVAFYHFLKMNLNKILICFCILVLLFGITTFNVIIVTENYKLTKLNYGLMDILTINFTVLMVFFSIIFHLSVHYRETPQISPIPKENARCKTTIIKNDDICILCQEEIFNNNNIVLVNCKFDGQHFYHENCYNLFTTNSPRPCLICR